MLLFAGSAPPLLAATLEKDLPVPWPSLQLRTQQNTGEKGASCLRIGGWEKRRDTTLTVRTQLGPSPFRVFLKISEVVKLHRTLQLLKLQFAEIPCFVVGLASF